MSLLTGTNRDPNVVLLLRSTLVPAWMADLASALMAADGLDVSALVFPDASTLRPARPSVALPRWRRLTGACVRLEPGRNRSEEDPFALLDLRRVAPALGMDAVAGDGPGVSIGVAVAVDSSLAHEDHAARGLRFRGGIWYSPQLDSGDGRVGFEDNEAAKYRGPGQLAVTVRSVEGTSGGERLVMAADIPLESVYAERNRVQAAWGAASLVFAALERASSSDRAVPTAPQADASAGGSRLGEDTEHGVTAPCASRPRLISHAGRVAVAAVRRVALKRQWLLAYDFGDARTLAPTENTRLVVPPADRYWADPMVVGASGEYHVFYEELPYRSGKGHIGTMRLGKNGPLDESRVALESDYHLSYPFVFAHEGEWFMIPESSEAQRIDVFRAEEFPLRWTLATTLMSGVNAVDTTVVEHEGRWWLFTTIQRLGGGSPISHLYLFSADSPLSESWEPHPMNPIVSGAAGARAAGGIIKRNGRLIRPSQDSRVSYGGRLQLSEIVALNRGEFRERPAGGLEPDVARGFIGLHTVSQAHDLTVVDLCRWRTRL